MIASFPIPMPALFCMAALTTWPCIVSLGLQFGIDFLYTVTLFANSLIDSPCIICFGVSAWFVLWNDLPRPWHTALGFFNRDWLVLGVTGVLYY